VFTLMISTASAMTPLGLLIAGPLADLFGVQMWFIIGGVVTALDGGSGLFHPRHRPYRGWAPPG
jgi:MFS transporter, DHA3 family, macrolide efflux protein